ncbi:MAG: MmcQ/YjbR family DNA-binding protein [Eubacterium sp.]|nr:MmcQ/YjbR family DNA-binding protein [Eubacterium sp.]
MKCDEIYPTLVDDLMALRGVERDYKPEWDWVRFSLRGKMFAAICADGTDSALLNIKAQPDYNETIRLLHEDINEGYYMNKEHWNSVRLTGSVPYEVVKDMYLRGYNLVLRKLPKKAQHEILEDI